MKVNFIQLKHVQYPLVILGGYGPVPPGGFPRPKIVPKPIYTIFFIYIYAYDKA